MMSDDEIIAVVEAHKEGKPIESREKGQTEWLKCIVPYWNFGQAEYRVAPEPRKPREWPVAVNTAGYLRSPDEHQEPFWEQIKVREVIELRSGEGISVGCT